MASTQVHSLTALIILMTCIVTGTQDQQSALPVFLVQADYYNVGYLVGKTFQKQIQEYYQLHPSLRTKYVPWIKTALGKKVYDEYVQVSNSTFPQYTLEMLGIAQGANLPFEEVFLINIMRELDAFLAGNISSVDSCSDVFVYSVNQVGYCHNEDASPLISGRGFIIDAEIYYPGSSKKIAEKFTFFTYPGTLPGNAFGFNGNGLTFSVDALYPKTVVRNKIPRNLLTRAMLAARTVEEVENILACSATGSAYAVSVNVGDTVAGTLYNIEIGPDVTKAGSLMSIYPVASNGSNTSVNYFHVNKFRRLSMPEIPPHVTSSKHRTARIEELLPADTLKKVRGILGDTADKEYPLYRVPSKTDDALTVATACYDIPKKTMDIYLGNPKSSEVFHSFPIGHV